MSWLHDECTARLIIILLLYKVNFNTIQDMTKINSNNRSSKWHYLAADWHLGDVTVLQGSVAITFRWDENLQALYEKLTQDFVCQKLQEDGTTDNSRPLRPRLRSYTVIDFCCNRKPIYDVLLVINCYLSSISHCFRDTASQSRKLAQPGLSFQI